MKSEIVPNNEKGKQVDLSQEIELASTSEAITIFNKARNTLLNPSSWAPITANSPASPLSVRDYIKIDIPAPGLSAGEGHDWVQVESIKEDIDPDADESFAMTVKVCANPEHPEKGVAHFFADGATSTFIIIRKGNTVRASYHGRNEKPNTENPSLGDKIRNVVVAIGAMAGISELQWRAFLEELLTD